MSQTRYRFFLFFTFTALLLFSMIQSGCAIFLLGAGAAGGYAVSKDEIEGHTDVSMNKVWNAMVDTVASEGSVVLKDQDHSQLEAIVRESEVKANLVQITPKTVQVRIKARKVKGLFPDIKLAQELYTKLIKRIE